MSSVNSGLSAFKKLKEEAKAREDARNRPKAEWLTSIFGEKKKFPDQITARFLQELDESSAGYNADNGLGLLAVEHTAPGPQGFLKRCLCTGIEDGEPCYACNEYRKDFKTWPKAKQNFYINVAVEVDGETKVFVLSRNANSPFVEQLYQEAIDEGSITDANYRIQRTGTGTQTNWLLKRLKGDPLDVAGLTTYDLNETVIRSVPFESQPAFFGTVEVESEGDEAVKTSAPASDEW